jgi:hypothetical protein
MTNVDKHHSRGLLEKVSKQNGCFALRVDNHQDTRGSRTSHSSHYSFPPPPYPHLKNTQEHDPRIPAKRHSHNGCLVESKKQIKSKKKRARKQGGAGLPSKEE